MPLSDITSRILDRARSAAGDVLAEAQRETEAALHEAAGRIGAESGRENERIAAEARALEQRAAATARLEAKKETLAARQEMIDSVLAEAMRSLAHANDAAYAAFLRARLLAAPMRGDVEIAVDDEERPRIEKALPALQQALREAGRELTLHLAAPGTTLSGGFVLRQGRIEFNASLDAIRRSQEEELRAVASSMLFPEE